MKYLLALPIAFFALTALGQTNSSPDVENCHYRTEDSHLVNSHSALLAQISASAEDKKKKRKRKKQRGTGTGQR